MIKTFVAYTTELDDVDAAVEEIMSQLQSGGGFLQNSVGIMACHFEFCLAGVAEAVCEALPFDVVGTISSPISADDKSDALMLSVMVISSDDTEFKTVFTPSLASEPGRVIAESYKEATAGRDDAPALILTFAPFMHQNSGDEYVEAITEVSGGAPCFGTLAVDDTADLSNCFMLHNGRHYPDRMSMVLCYGNISPKFYIANVPSDKALGKSALVTKSEGHIIMEINGRPVFEFFKDLGLAEFVDKIYAMSTLPFLLDYNDGTPMVSKIFITLTPEGHALCASAVPEGSHVSVAQMDRNDVMNATAVAAEQIMADAQNAAGLLVYSCVGRFMALGSEQFDESRLIYDKIGGTPPYMMMCSGGEICPTQVKGGNATNRFHNNAFVACLF